MDIVSYKNNVKTTLYSLQVSGNRYSVAGPFVLKIRIDESKTSTTIKLVDLAPGSLYELTFAISLNEGKHDKY